MTQATKTMIRRGGSLLAGLLALGALAFAFTSGLVHGERPIGTADRVEVAHAEALPPGSTVVAVGTAAGVVPPMVLAASAASPGGLALVLSQGQGGGSEPGRALFRADLDQAGDYTLWLRCRWSDGCGNSIAVSVNGAGPVTVGQDALYGVWQWVDGGVHGLAPGAAEIALIEREDGVAVDQLLLVPGAARFLPRGAIHDDGRIEAGLRRFADRFDRSPGHGNAGWQFPAGAWEIAFSLDPNRIPEQFALRAQPGETGAGIALLDGPPWAGARVAVSVLRDSSAAMPGILFHGTSGSVAVLPGDAAAALPDDCVILRMPAETLPPGQWCRVEAVRWGWTIAVDVDGREVARWDDLPSPECGRPGLLIAGGGALFDDIAVEEVAWAADDGGEFRLSWRSASADARWYRPRQGAAEWALAGRRGGLVHTSDTGPIGEALVVAVDPVHLARLQLPAGTSTRGAVAVLPGGPHGADRLELAAAGLSRIRRVAVRRHEPPAPEAVVIGPYTFCEARIPDPADYLDFTDEEWQAIAASPEADKLARQPKFNELVGSSGEYAVWERRSGSWAVQDGWLKGAGPGSVVRFWQELDGPVDLSLRVRFTRPTDAADIILAERGGEGIPIRLGAADAADGAPLDAVLPVGDDAGYALEISLREDAIVWRVNSAEPRRRSVQRGIGGGIAIAIRRGRTAVDDVSFSVPRRLDAGGLKSRFYAFDRRETDWWRQGNWVDHGGIACVLASSWISLLAPESDGLLVHKEDFGRDVMVAFNIEESSEWLGWTQRPSRVHHPFDHIHVVLAEERGDLAGGYRLEVNSRDRSATVLYRRGVEVASVAQRRGFPIRYVGGHAPYSPRRNRISLVRSNGDLLAVVNGQEVLRYTDPDPLTTPVVGIGGSRTHVNISRVLVRELEVPAEPRHTLNGG